MSSLGTGFKNDISCFLSEVDELIVDDFDHVFPKRNWNYMFRNIFETRWQGIESEKSIRVRGGGESEARRI